MRFFLDGNLYLCCLGLDTVQTGRWVTTFWKSILLPSLGKNYTVIMNMEAVYRFETFVAIY